jgi:hypothetical protein
MVLATAPAFNPIAHLVEHAQQEAYEIGMVVSLKSANQKTGPMVTVGRPQITCPEYCPWFNKGCYGLNRSHGGRPSMFQQVSQAKPFDILDIPRLAPKNSPGVRWNSVGDYLTKDKTPDFDYISKSNIVATSRDWMNIAYTHAWKQLEPSWFDYVVRASCQTREEIEEAEALGWSTAVVDTGPGDPDTLIGQDIAGKRVVQCPATLPESKVTCSSCGLCGKRTRSIIAFPAHGQQRTAVKNALKEMRA